VDEDCGFVTWKLDVGCVIGHKIQRGDDLGWETGDRCWRQVVDDSQSEIHFAFHASYSRVEIHVNGFDLACARGSRICVWNRDVNGCGGEDWGIAMHGGSWTRASLGTH